MSDRVERYGGEEYVVRPVTGSAAWPVVPSMFSDSGLDERRHWHTACWRARDRRR